jgi:hypothetical protein
MNLSRFNERLHGIRQRLMRPAEPVRAERTPPAYPDLSPTQRAFRKARLAKADEIARALRAKGL